MSQVDLYLDAAERANTRRSYASAIQHFEIEWGGLLPATIDSIARYLATYAESLSLNTLKHRVVALSRWHQDHGFPDPTKGPKVRQILKGIRAVHPSIEKRAKPLELDILQQASDWLDNAIAAAQGRGDFASVLRHTRNRALMLLGFWRGFRADELTNLRIEHVQITPGEGLTCYLPRSKGDRNLDGRSFECPALSRLCPVFAVEAWLASAELVEGPLFRKIDRWGHLADDGLQPGSIIPLLRNLLAVAGIMDSDDYSSHSLRRGFADWARLSGWDIRELMAYVGWRDIKAAMRYLDGADVGLKARFEQGLQVKAPVEPVQASKPELPPIPAQPHVTIQVIFKLTPFSPSERVISRVQRLIEQSCLARYGMQRIDTAGTQYNLSVPKPSPEELDDALYALLDDMHRIADNNQCFLEATCHDPATNAYWD